MGLHAPARIGRGVLTANSSTQFPLVSHSSGRYLVDACGRPFIVRDCKCWTLMASFSVADFTFTLDSLVASGFNAVTCMAICHDYEELTGKTAGTGPQNAAGNWPFLKNTTGATYDGTGVSAPVNGGSSTATKWADFSTWNTAYFADVDAMLTAALLRGMLVFFFPAYLGFSGLIEGWDADFLQTLNQASTCANVNAYGQFIGARYKNFPNIIWMMGGDFSPSSWTSGTTTAEEQLALGIRSGGAKQLMAGHFPFSSGLPTDIGSVSSTLAGLMGFNTNYAWQNQAAMYQDPTTAWGISPAVPVMSFDPGSRYDNSNGSEVLVPGAGTQQTRNDAWWGAIASIGGHSYGNLPIFYGGTGTFSNINSSIGLAGPGIGFQKILNAFMSSLPWHILQPSGQAGQPTLITAGGGTNGGTDWVQSACASDGSVLIAYVPTAHTGTVTVAMTALAGTCTASWLDPTNGTYQAIGSFANTGTHAFTTPGTNAGGDNDWVLLLRAP